MRTISERGLARWPAVQPAHRSARRNRARLAADDRLDALRGLLGELERAEEVAGIGDAERRHLVAVGELDERLQRQRALEQRIGRVAVQMDEAWAFGQRSILSSRSL